MKTREENGQFTTRAQLKKIPRLGAKTYEQAIGFLRVPEAKIRLMLQVFILRAMILLSKY